jgi:hypothetical protein
MHTFKETNKSYIGYTGLTLSKRLHKHVTNSQAGHNTHFYKAIRKYGLKSIVSKIIFECNSNEKLKISKQMSKKEIDIFNNEEWIKGRKYGIKNN